VARDYAKKRAQSQRKAPARKKQPAKAAQQASSGSGLRWYGAGVLTGIFLSFLLYLGTLPPAGTATQNPAQAEQLPTESAPKPRFDFYTMLPEQTIEEDSPRAEAATTRGANRPNEYYLLQAGSFRQRDDADRRRAELLLLGLEPRVEENNGDNGRWFRVYLGPFESRAKMSKARSLTAAQNIDTLVLKRSG
jgi:cell division protein FtsN